MVLGSKWRKTRDREADRYPVGLCMSHGEWRLSVYDSEQWAPDDVFTLNEGYQYNSTPPKT